MWPPHPTHHKHPAKLRNEIMFLTAEPFKSAPYVPKLIGYSIDRSLAVVYELKANTTLRAALANGKLGSWNDRLNVAVQIAQLLKNFHEEGIGIGSIDPANILIDEDGNIKLGEFGYCARIRELQEAKELNINLDNTIYSISRVEPRGTEADIFAFGCLLAELIITKLDLFTIRARGDSYSCCALEVLESGEYSQLHEFLVNDEHTRSGIAEVVMNCLKRAPEQRWKADAIARKLMDLKQGSVSKKPKTDTC